MWHLSVSVWSGAGKQVIAPEIAEKEAVRCLRGVGNTREWWAWNEQARVGHLRVGVTAAEFDLIPPGVAEHDAGFTGPERKRT